MTEVKRGKGCPPKTILEYARTAYWSWSVRKLARVMNFAEIERKVNPKETPTREGSGFGYVQPHAWSKYANGERTCTPPKKGQKSPVVRAEKHFPGGRAAYEMFAWDVIANPGKGFNDFNNVYKLISSEVLNGLEKSDFEPGTSRKDLFLSPKGIHKVASIRHLDALAVLLLQWRGGRRSLTQYDVYHLYTWLMHASRWDFAFRKSKGLMLSMFEQYVPEVAVFANEEALSFNYPKDFLSLCFETTCWFCDQKPQGTIL